MLITDNILNEYSSYSEFLSSRPILDVYLDMDGVLCDWNKAACELMNVDYDSINWEGDEEAFEKVVDKDDLREEINNGFDQFFINISPFDHAKDILDVGEKANAIILTAPFKKCPGVYHGKIEWINKYWPNTDRIILTKHKEHCAKPTSLLVDDRWSNCSKFIEAGGNAILFPSEIFDGGIEVESVIKLIDAIADFKHSPKISLND